MKALIIDDERLARKELTTLLEKHDNIEIVGEAANADDFGRMPHANDRVLKQCRANTLSLPVSVYCQPAENDHRQGIWHIPPERTWRIRSG